MTVLLLCVLIFNSDFYNAVLRHVQKVFTVSSFPTPP